MAATFTVEDGTGLAAANAYVAVATATQYAENHLDTPADWTGLSSDAQELHIRNATRYLDAMFGRRWRGFRANEDQALDWPRSGAVDDSDYELDDDSLPTQLEDACCVMAFADIDDNLFPDQTAPGDLKRVRLQVGPLVTDKTYVAGQSQTKNYRLAKALLADLLDPATTLERG